MFLRELFSIKDNIAIEDDLGKAKTYGDLEILSREYLKMIPPRSFIFILCDYSIETVAFYYSMMNNHVVPLLLDKTFDPQMLQNLVEIYRPQFLWGTEPRLLQIKTIKSFNHINGHVIAQTGYDAPEMHDRLALLLTTSGSTGSPKLVRLSYENIRAEALGTALALKINQSDKMFTTLPMNYCYGLCLLHTHWMAGATAHITECSLLQSAFWENANIYGITNFSGVPFSFELLEKMNFLDNPPQTLRFVMIGGGGLSEEMWKKYCEQLPQKNIQFYMAYGQTEVLGRTAGFLSFPEGEKWGCIGLPDPGCETVVGENSELMIYGACVCLGYAAGREDLAHGDNNHGVLHTGDIAYMDEDGFIYLRGRLKRFIKMTGMRVSLDEVESLLAQEFPEHSFACVGHDDDLQIIHTGELNAQEIIRFCQTRMGLLRNAVTVRKVEVIPRNSSGKVMYQKVEQYAGQN